MGKTLHFKVICNHEIAIIQENSEYIVQDYSLITSTTKAEKYCTFSEAFTRWNGAINELIDSLPEI